MDRKKQFIIEHVLYEFLGNGNLSRYDDFVETDIKIHHPQSAQKLGLYNVDNRKNAKIVDKYYSEAFKVEKVEINDLLGDEDKVVVRWGFEGIHRADFFFMKASGNPVKVTGQTIYRVNEKIQEVWHAWDLLGLQEQIQTRSGKMELLSSKEKECVKHYLLGKTAKETAICMGLSFRTVEYYFENIKNKLGCSTKRELITLLERTNLTL